MFVGHYAVSFVLRATQKKLSLGALFLGVQFIDLLFFSLTLIGIEKFTIIENYTESTHFKLDFMPYSHSLIAVILWSVFILIVLNVLRKKDNKNGRHFSVLLAIAVISHWWLDLIVHTPDLPIFLDNSSFFGFGLWNNAVLTYLLEAVILIGGLCFYLKSTPQSGMSKTFVSRFGMIIFVVILLAINVLNIFGPLSHEDTNTSTAITAITAYCVFAAIAFWLDKKRVG